MHRFCMLVLSCVLLSSPPVMAENALPPDYIKYPVLVTLDSGKTASGFYINDELGEAYFVTAKHLLFHRNEAGEEVLTGTKALLMSYPKEEAIKDAMLIQIDLTELYSFGYLRKHETSDIAVIKIGAIQGPEGMQSLQFYPGVYLAAKAGEQAVTGSLVGAHAGVIRPYESVAVGNEAFIFGYPISLGIQAYPQIDYEKPLLRKGVIAGKNDENQSIILDCPVHYGNSGGPVVEVEKVGITETRYYIIGMVAEFIPFDDKWYGLEHPFKSPQIENSGYSVVIPMDTILELIQTTDKSIPSKQDQPAPALG